MSANNLTGDACINQTAVSLSARLSIFFVIYCSCSSLLLIMFSFVLQDHSSSACLVCHTCAIPAHGSCHPPLLLNYLPLPAIHPLHSISSLQAFLNKPSLSSPYPYVCVQRLGQPCKNCNFSLPKEMDFPAKFFQCSRLIFQPKHVWIFGYNYLCSNGFHVNLK